MCQSRGTSLLVFSLNHVLPHSVSVHSPNAPSPNLVNFQPAEKVNDNKVTVKPVFSDPINIFWLFRQVVAYCCMEVVQKASALLSFSNKQLPVYSDCQVT